MMGFFRGQLSCLRHSLYLADALSNVNRKNLHVLAHAKAELRITPVRAPFIYQ